MPRSTTHPSLRSQVSAQSAQKSSAPKKAPQDISSFTELTTKRTGASTSSLPARDRSSSSAVKVPIKVVPRFTTRPASVVVETMNGAELSNVEIRKEEPRVTGSSSKASPSAFASSKATRSAKSSYTNDAATPAPPRPTTIPSDTGSFTLPVVRPPSSGLELVDRLEGLAGDDDQRWRLLEVRSFRLSLCTRTDS